MLISKKYRFIIACPTKTGTNTMRAIVEKFKRGGGSPNVLTLLTGEASTRHRIAPPPGLDDYTRFMMVREPQARLVSMYEYLRRKDWEWKAKDIIQAEKGGGREAGWLRMLGLIAEHRALDGYYAGGMRKAHGGRPYMWTDRQSEMLRFLYGTDMDGSHLPWYHNRAWDMTKAIQLEMLPSYWGNILRSFGVQEQELYDIVIPHRNSTDKGSKLFSTTAEYMAVPGASSLAKYCLGDDAEEIGYINGRFGDG